MKNILLVESRALVKNASKVDDVKRDIAKEKRHTFEAEPIGGEKGYIGTKGDGRQPNHSV
jgi:hypothetical protein